ncbi:MAG: glycine cleavage system aminomethyltransferase GcvT [Candidatus Dadabacteria bacterium]|nr:glycine cleavage system aminomethyltransferase GcvT [Candidatus Dadabacteria bacterium]
MSRTALYETHIENGAKMTGFSGWSMPVSYSGIREEHRAVRSGCGIFDAGHMGEIEITGPGAEMFCQWLVTNDVTRMADMSAQYNLLCNEEGGILDDLMVYRFSGSRFILCVNASNTERNLEWISSHAGAFDAGVRDLSREFSLIAVQGPDSAKVAAGALGGDARLPGRFCVAGFQRGGEAFISGTGYTGEDGFEIFVPWDSAPELWAALCDGATMCGLGCRDTLRLEMGYTLYGNEIDESTNPFEANLGRYVKMEKGDFCGRDALGRVLEAGPGRALCGFVMDEPGIARSGCRVFCEETEAGKVTSGTMSPSLNAALGLAMMDSGAVARARSAGIRVEIRNHRKKAAITDPPFCAKGGHATGEAGTS